jgi:hypothetical protein
MRYDHIMWVCLYICMYMYMYIYITFYIYMYIYIYVCIYIYIYTHTSVCVCPMTFTYVRKRDTYVDNLTCPTFTWIHNVYFPNNESTLKNHRTVCTHAPWKHIYTAISMNAYILCMHTHKHTYRKYLYACVHTVMHMWYVLCTFMFIVP